MKTTLLQWAIIVTAVVAIGYYFSVEWANGRQRAAAEVALLQSASRISDSQLRKMELLDMYHDAKAYREEHGLSR